MPGLLVWVTEEEGEECSILALPRRRYGRRESLRERAWRVAIVPGQAVPTGGGRRFVCERGVCVLKTRPAQEPAGSCSHLKGPGSLSKASAPGLLPLPFRCRPERWTGYHCSLKRVKGECLGNIRFVRQAAVGVLCVFMPQFAWLLPLLQRSVVVC